MEIFTLPRTGALLLNLSMQMCWVKTRNGPLPLVADYDNKGILYAGFSTVVNQSIDGGNSWSSLSPLPSNGIHDNEISALAIAKSNPGVVYAARRIRFEYQSPPGMYRTTDGGSTWKDITSNLPDSLYYTSLDVSQTDANTAYLALAGLVPGNKYINR